MVCPATNVDWLQQGSERKATSGPHTGTCFRLPRLSGTSPPGQVGASPWRTLRVERARIWQRYNGPRTLHLPKKREIKKSVRMLCSSEQCPGS